MLIGVCGKAGSGKDTIGDYLVKLYGFKKIALADPIKRLVKDVFVLDDYTVYDRIAREEPLEQWEGWTVRKLLQFIGTELFRDNIDKEIWVKSLWLKVQSDPNNNYLISDLRFPNEQKYLKERAGKNFSLIKVKRAGCEGVVGLSNHASEAYDLEGDYEITNDGSFEELYDKIDKIMKELS